MKRILFVFAACLALAASLPQAMAQRPFPGNDNDRPMNTIESVRRAINDMIVQFGDDGILDIVDGIKGEDVGGKMAVALKAGYNALIRVSADEFVPDERASFNVPQTDAAIEAALDGRTCMPVKGFAGFPAFPPCGLLWNAFLLESYVLRFSGMFTLMTNMNAFNNNNTGAVVRKDANYEDYDALLVDAVARGFERQEFPVLDKENVASWLVDKGYMERASSKVDAVVAKVRKRLK